MIKSLFLSSNKINAITLKYSQKRVSYGFSSSNQQLPRVPYQFGGFPQHSFYFNEKSNELINKLFQIRPQKKFIEGYIKLLTALQKKDTNYLNEHLERNLVKDIDKLPEVKLINKEAPIQMKIQKVMLISNMSFDRDVNGEQMVLRNQNSRFKQSLQLYESSTLKTINNPSSILNLFIIRVCFKSKMKLVKIQKKGKKQSDEENKQQWHSVQFELQRQATRFQMIFRKAANKIRFFRDKNQERQQMMVFLVGGNLYNPQWRIGDVDGVLVGNLPKKTNNKLEKQILNRSEYMSKLNNKK